MNSPLTDRPDIDAALRRAGDDAQLLSAARFLAEALAADELVLEGARTKAHEFEGAAFVTTRRILVQTGSATDAAFESLDLDSLTNVTLRNDEGTWALVAEAFAAYKVWGGFAERAAQRLHFAAQWALTLGREARIHAERSHSSLDIYDMWRPHRKRLQELQNEDLIAALSDVFSNDNTSRWWIQ